MEEILRILFLILFSFFICTTHNWGEEWYKICLLDVGISGAVLIDQSCRFEQYGIMTIIAIILILYYVAELLNMFFKKGE